MVDALHGQSVIFRPHLAVTPRDDQSGGYRLPSRYLARGAVSKFPHREEKALLCRLLNGQAGPLSAIY
jgi:hypothetical protein